MHPPIDNEPLTISTEDGNNRWAILLFHICCGSIACGLSLFIFHARKTDSPIDVRDCVFISLFTLAQYLSMFLVLLLRRGTCVIDSKGLSYRPLIGRARSFRWVEVELAFVSTPQLRFITKGLRIDIWLFLFNKKKIECTVQRIESTLEQDFNPPLRQCPASFRETASNAIRSLPKMLTVSAIVIAWYWVGYCLLVLTRPETKEPISIPLIMAWLFVPAFPLVPFICMGIYKEAKGQTDYYWRRKAL